MTNHGDAGNAAVADRVRLGIGAPRPVRHQQGPRGSGADALRLLQDDPEQPKRLERAAPLLVPLARSAPLPRGAACSFCDSAGLLRNNRNPKPAYPAFRSFATEWVRPRASITGAGPGKLHRGFDPELLVQIERARLHLRLPGRCRPLQPCGSPYTLPRLSDGPHTFFVKAIDAPGNESQVVSRSFTVDTGRPRWRSPPVRRRARSRPTRVPHSASPPTIPSASLSCQLDGGGFAACGSPFTASGLADGPHTFQVKATDRAQNTRIVSRSWTVDTTPRR